MRKSTKRKAKRLKMMSNVEIIFLLGCLSAMWTINVGAENFSETRKNETQSSKDSRGLFSPRMDYEQWKPLGRGDPLQNDPTYDYVPPVLERVHYWIEPPMKKSDTKPSSSPHDVKKSEILVLGVSSKKPSTSTAESRKDLYDSYLKYIDGPKYYSHNSFDRPNIGRRPSHNIPHAYHPQFYKNKFDDNPYRSEEQRMPYTVLVPPPISPPHVEMPIFNSQNPSPKQPTTTQRPVYKPLTTTSPPNSKVSVQEANLIYHSSSTGVNNQWQGSYNQYPPLTASSQYVTWRTPVDSSPLQNSFYETITKGNPIVFPKNTTESVQKYIVRSTESPKSSPLPVIFPTEASEQIVFEHSPYKPTVQSFEVSQQSNVGSSSGIFSDIIVSGAPLPVPPTGNPALHMLHVTGTQPAITHMAVGNQPMHKGQVSDDTIGNTYVNIGKPNAHIQKEVTISKAPNLNTSHTPSNSNIDYTSSMIKPMMQMPLLPVVYSNNKPTSSFVNHNTPISNGSPFNRRPGPITEDFTLQTMQTMQPPPISSTTERIELYNKKTTGFLQSLLQKESTPSHSTITTFMTTPSTFATPTATTSTTSVSSLTTDPLFKHYKQPAEPLKGPMYLIIQGHSKVKTYGATHKGAIHDISMPETNEIPELGEENSVKHLHSKKENYRRDESTRSKGARKLKSFVDKSETKETEVKANYQIGVEEGVTTTEKYIKGIVESEKISIGDRITGKFSNRQKRQLEEFIPVVEDAMESYVYSYLKKQSEGSGVGAIVASAITDDSSDALIEDLPNPLDDSDEDDDDEDDS